MRYLVIIIFLLCVGCNNGWVLDEQGKEVNDRMGAERDWVDRLD